MKKLVLLASVIATISFASCGNKAAEEAAKKTADSIAAVEAALKEQQTADSIAAVEAAKAQAVADSIVADSIAKSAKKK